jgi:hypothetical protein
VCYTGTAEPLTENQEVPMPYNSDDNWVYETEPLGMGDPLRVALSHLQRNLEAFLYDKRDPGYANPDFIAWALEHSKVTASSSGTPANTALRWDPKYADESIDSSPDSDNPGRFYDGVIHTLKPEFGTDADAVEGKDFGPNEVTRPEFARLINADAVVVPAHDEDEGPSEASDTSVPGVPYPADPDTQTPGDAEDLDVVQDDEATPGSDEDDPHAEPAPDPAEHEVIETPADEYEPVPDEDKE